MSGRLTLDVDHARRVAGSVVDPEIPVVTIEDLGVLRDVAIEDGRVLVTITPTYSGCPAMRQIEDDLRRVLSEAGFDRVEVEVSPHPVWTTDLIGPSAREKLARFGIAPPTSPQEVLCPRCRSGSPRMVGRFGSTACKALMVCTRCGEPFDYFKEF